MKKVNLLVLLLGLLLTSQSKAGQETHGGDVLVCDDGRSTVLDYYYATLPGLNGPHEIDPIEGLSAAEVQSMVLDKVKGSYFHKALKGAVEQFGDINKWVATGHLDDINDDGLPFSLPSNCHLEQGAVRTSNQVYVDVGIVRGLPSGEHGVLALHESIYSLVKENNSLGVKEVIREILSKNISINRLARSVRNIGVPFYGWESIRQGAYCSRQKSLYAQIYDVSDLANKRFTMVLWKDGLSKSVSVTCPDELQGACRLTEGNSGDSDFPTEIVTNEDMGLGFALKFPDGSTWYFDYCQ